MCKFYLVYAFTIGNGKSDCGVTRGEEDCRKIGSVSIILYHMGIKEAEAMVVVSIWPSKDN